MKQSLNLVRKAFCDKRGIKTLAPSAFVYQRTDRFRGNAIFLASPPGGVPEMYEHPRQDLSGLSLNKALSIPKDMQSSREVILNKDHIASWVNAKVNAQLLPEDIDKVLLDGRKVSVILSPNSMRFKGTFTLYFL